jgi:bifunctional ADP-heptose synthase (sugar kinase/adenylyltransferase)
MISLSRLEGILSGLPRLTIGLVGDLFLDRYLDLDPALVETSIETGLEAYQVTRVRNSPGALGTVMNNLAALGVGRLVPVTIVGDDGQAYDLLNELGKLPVDVEYILRDPNRLTPTYTKPMRRDAAGNWHELNRIDLRNNAQPSHETEQRLVEQLTNVFRGVDGLIVLDQVNEEEMGVITSGVRERLAILSHGEPQKTVFVDSRQRINRFRFGTLKPNVAECLTALAECGGANMTNLDEMATARHAAHALSKQTSRPLFCTLGDRGMLIVGFDGSDHVEHVPGFPLTGPIDIVGAGDSATAGIVSALLCGASPAEAATMGNLVASITVQQLGTTGTASPEQVIARWKECQAR